MKFYFTFFLIFLLNITSAQQGSKLTNEQSKIALINYMKDKGLYSTCGISGNNLKVIIQFSIKVEKNARYEYAKDYGKEYYIIETSQRSCGTGEVFTLYRAFVQNAYTGSIKFHQWDQNQSLVATALNYEINKIQGKYSEVEKRINKDIEEERKSEGHYVFNVNKTTQIEDFVTMDDDLGKLTFREAQIAIKKLGQGWRLPSLSELKKINNLRVDSKLYGKRYYYMSSENEYALGDSIFYTTYEKSFGDIVRNNIKKNYQILNGLRVLKEDKSFVRAVKSVDGYETVGQTNFTIGNTITIGNLEIMTVDLGKMKWVNAKKACEKLGEGWRLPSVTEIGNLNEFNESLLYKINLMPNESYWAIEEGGNQTPYSFARVFEFANGKFWNLNDIKAKSSFLNVRAFKTKKININQRFIDKSKNIEIMKSDFLRGTNWVEMNKKVTEIGNGWRLPTDDELKYISNVLEKNRLVGCYWVDDEDYKTSSYSSDYQKYHKVGNCNSKYLQAWQNLNVILVKDIL